MLASAITSEAVTSQDGTRIGYLRQGEGPGVVLVQGAMADVQAYRDLASALSASFTVISAERRGRGLSPRPYNCGHTIARDVEDLDAVMAATGATTLFGLSSGAVITLEATRTLPRVQSAIVYEPPFYSGGVDRAGIARLHAEIDEATGPRHWWTHCSPPVLPPRSCGGHRAGWHACSPAWSWLSTAKSGARVQRFATCCPGSGTTFTTWPASTAASTPSRTSPNPSCY